MQIGNTNGCYLAIKFPLRRGHYSASISFLPRFTIPLKNSTNVRLKIKYCSVRWVDSKANTYKLFWFVWGWVFATASDTVRNGHPPDSWSSSDNYLIDHHHHQQKLYSQPTYWYTCTRFSSLDAESLVDGKYQLAARVVILSLVKTVLCRDLILVIHGHWHWHWFSYFVLEYILILSRDNNRDW